METMMLGWASSQSWWGIATTIIVIANANKDTPASVNFLIHPTT